MADDPKPSSDPNGGGLPVAQILQSQPPVSAQGVDAGFAPVPAPPPGPLIAGWQVPPPPAPAPFSPPVFGALAVIFGVSAFYKATLLLGPLAIVVGLIACLRKQWAWGLIGMLSAAAALAVDPYFWGLAGIYYIARLLGLVG
ncbi:MAG TPA: hypothetical protein VHA35_19120 [Dongiaceae bacterium]|jgi:hypothetical protein|nr:hypothetical protein [Dongiaceae bacterium]